MEDHLTQASKIKRKPVSRFWHERFIRGAVNVVSGPKKTAKSLFTIKVTADESHHAPVIYSNLEDAKSVQRDRLQVAGAKMTDVYLPRAGYSIPDDVAHLELDVERLGAKLIIMDTANKHVTASLVKSDQRAALALTPLALMCEKWDCGLIFVDHTFKQIPKGADPLYAVASGLLGTARMVALFGWHPQDPQQRVFLPVADQYDEPRKGVTFEFDTEDVRHGRKSYGIALLRTVEKDFEIPDPLNIVRMAGHGREENTAKRAEAAEWLTKQLSFAPVFVNELKENAEADGLSWATVRRAREAIGIAQGRKGFGKGSKSYWKLPDGHPALAPNAPSKL